jgi:thiamine-monophosphate kinase
MEYPAGEFGLIQRFRDRAKLGSGVRVGIGDDCAVLAATHGCETLVTTDMLMDGRHFRLDEAGPVAVGYKSLAVSLSDIAAMAGKPTAAFVAVALPRADAETLALGLLEGMTALANQFEVTLAGGDTNAWDGPLVICVTVLGTTVPPGPVMRTGARPGDRIFVTGPLGGSLLGRHLRPIPRVTEALALHEAVSLRAMIDVSDGLASDLTHILEESGNLGATLDANAIPIHDDAARISGHDGRSSLDHALNDGEDFELCFVVSHADADRLIEPRDGFSYLRHIGRIDAEPGIRLALGDGRTDLIQPRGFDHLRSHGS